VETSGKRANPPPFRCNLFPLFFGVNTMANFGPIAKLGDDECKKIFEKYDALDASSSGMDATEFKAMLRQEFCIQGSDAELDKEFAAANKDNSADTLGEDLCCEEFIEWVKSKRQ